MIQNGGSSAAAGLKEAEVIKKTSLKIFKGLADFNVEDSERYS